MAMAFLSRRPIFYLIYETCLLYGYFLVAVFADSFLKDGCTPFLLNRINLYKHFIFLHDCITEQNGK